MKIDFTEVPEVKSVKNLTISSDLGTGEVLYVRISEHAPGALKITTSYVAKIHIKPSVSNGDTEILLSVL